jgi:hypothetical protein
VSLFGDIGAKKSLTAKERNVMREVAQKKGHKKINRKGDALSVSK